MATARTASTARAAQGALDREQMIAKLRGKQPVVDHYDVLLRDAEAAELTAAAQDLAMAEAFAVDRDHDPKVTTARARLDRAQAAAADVTVRINLRGLPRPDFEALQLAHPPTDEQQTKGQRYNVDTFCPALIAACTFDPALSEADVNDMFAGWGEPERAWTQGEVGELYDKALGVNQHTRNGALPKGFGATRG